MGLFTYHRLGKVKKNQRENLQELRNQERLQRNALKAQKANDALKKTELRRKHNAEERSTIGNVRIKIYNYLEKSHFTNIRINIKLNASVSATYPKSGNKEFFINAFNNINNQLFFIRDYISHAHVALYSLNDLILVNDGDNPVFGHDDIKAYRNKLKQQKKQADIQHARNLKIKMKQTRLKAIKDTKIWSVVWMIFVPTLSFLFYLVTIIKNAINHKNDSVWTNKQIGIIMVITFIWDAVLISNGYFL